MPRPIAGLAAVVLLASSCGSEPDCPLGEERCQGNVPQYCVQSPTSTLDHTMWLDGQRCPQELVCRVGTNGKVSCVSP